MHGPYLSDRTEANVKQTTKPNQNIVNEQSDTWMSTESVRMKRKQKSGEKEKNNHTNWRRKKYGYRNRDESALQITQIKIHHNRIKSVWMKKKDWRWNRVQRIMLNNISFFNVQLFQCSCIMSKSIVNVE